MRTQIKECVFSVADIRFLFTCVVAFSVVTCMITWGNYAGARNDQVYRVKTDERLRKHTKFDDLIIFFTTSLFNGNVKGC